MQDAVEKFGFRVHAYCLITNHVHLAVQVGETPLSCIMQNLSLRYTTLINRRLNRSGHLFQGRYKAVLLDAESFLLELFSYIHLNPVRAGKVATPDNHPWSSHRAYLGKEIVPWLTTDQVLSLIGNHLDKARKLFAHFVEKRTDDGHRDEFHHGGDIDSRLLGKERIVDEVMKRASMRRELKPTVGEVLKTVKAICTIDNEQLSSRQRGRSITEACTLPAWAVWEFSDGTISELGRIFGHDVSTLSACIRRLRLKASHNFQNCRQDISDKTDSHLLENKNIETCTQVNKL